MSDESDETRRFSPGDDTEPVEPPAGAGSAGAGSAGAGSAGTGSVGTGSAGAGDDAGTESTGADTGDKDAAGAPTRGVAPVPPPSDEDTLGGGRSRDDDTIDDTRRVPTIKDEPTAVAPRPDTTAVMPPAVDDWAPSRANPAWSGRAEVRAPQPGRGYPEVDWAAAATPEQRDRWWMPILVGLIALVLLAVLGWAIYLIVQNSDDEPAPTPTSTSVVPAPSVATQTTPPSTAPTTTTIATMPSTTEPVITEVPVPALRGLALPEAQAALNRTGLSYRLIFRSVDAPAGTVIDSDPAEGQEVPPDTVVTLVVAAEGAATLPTVTTGSTTGPGTDGE